MVFCEQKLLWQLIKDQNLNHKYLFNETLICYKDEWITNNLGIYSFKDQYKYAVHFGPDKRRALDISHDYYRESTQQILEVFYKLFPELSNSISNILKKGHV